MRLCHRQSLIQGLAEEFSRILCIYLLHSLSWILLKVLLHCLLHLFVVFRSKFDHDRRIEVAILLASVLLAIEVPGDLLVAPILLLLLLLVLVRPLEQLWKHTLIL